MKISDALKIHYSYPLPLYPVMEEERFVGAFSRENLLKIAAKKENRNKELSEFIEKMIEELHPWDMVKKIFSFDVPPEKIPIFSTSGELIEIVKPSHFVSLVEKEPPPAGISSWSSVLKAIPGLLILADENGRIIYSNRKISLKNIRNLIKKGPFLWKDVELDGKKKACLLTTPEGFLLFCPDEIPPLNLNLKEATEKLEKELLSIALSQSKSYSEAAKKLGISLQKLKRLIEKWKEPRFSKPCRG